MPALKMLFSLGWTIMMFTLSAGINISDSRIIEITYGIVHPLMKIGGMESYWCNQYIV
jgi:hypothetical protein